VSSRALLLVDTDPAVQEGLEQSLRRENRTIEVALDGHKALARLRANACDLLVAGQTGNGLDGLKLLRRARAIRPDLKVIVAGAPDPQQAVRALRERAYGYIHKPVAPAALAELVQQALESDSWREDLRVLSALPEWVTFELRCRMEAVERTTHHVREILADLPAQTCEDISIAFRELLMNAVEHGGKYDPRKRVRASVLRTGRSVVVHIADPGHGFNLDFLPHAAISNPDDSPIQHVEFRTGQGQRPGGFGILMSRRLVDELLYNERGNAVLFVKYL
jgi:two-component system, OmpR family, response regulator